MLEKNPYKYNGESLVFDEDSKNTKTKNVYLESYGCAMNFSDSEIVMSILSNIGYQSTGNINHADLILAIGTRLGFNSTFYSYDNISKSAKIVQVDIDPIALGN